MQNLLTRLSADSSPLLFLYSRSKCPFCSCFAIITDCCSIYILHLLSSYIANLYKIVKNQRISQLILYFLSVKMNDRCTTTGIIAKTELKRIFVINSNAMRDYNNTIILYLSFLLNCLHKCILSKARNTGLLRSLFIR